MAPKRTFQSTLDREIARCNARLADLAEQAQPRTDGVAYLWDLRALVDRERLTLMLDQQKAS